MQQQTDCGRAAQAAAVKDDDAEQLSNSAIFSRVLGSTGLPMGAQGSCGVGQPYSSELCAYAPTYDNYVYQMKMESRASPYNRPAVPYPGYPTPTTQAYNSLYPPRTKQTTSYDY
ncbi:hypothetical protein IscW_ISCW003116 [Ixodes scapularis]|uniref:Uncharacterized protein n=1 Tax=Ixodes scapularis TaxID=6945 RepID=B7PBE5_IXOSC|nr:hypothetical protein IscW_ISCW003116 [Ixodes scapularis]|eukprot:XP_002407998.1 hypothetical protein IscW_ISCW003116 [Ixodes scapularis]